MKLSPAGLLEHARSPEGRKQLRYVGVSAVFVPLGQLLVQVLRWGAGIYEVYAVFITACVLTPPNYLSNKYIVWQHKSKDNRVTEITVFWLAAVLGTLCAMLFVYLAGRWFPDRPDAEFRHAAAIFIAQLLGYGIVWIARYVFLDRLIFKATHHGDEPPTQVLDELHRDFPV
ncbi:MAG: GtrA family protein [Microthrixaceae bacterium]